MKKEKKLKKFKKMLSSPIMYMVLTIVFSVILSHIETSHAISNYLYNSSDVSYDNTVSGIVATDVQGAVDELYFHATDYSEIKNKIGNDALNTTSQTLTGGINELNGEMESLIKIVQRSSSSLTITAGSSTAFSLGIPSQNGYTLISVYPSTVPNADANRIRWSVYSGNTIYGVVDGGWSTTGSVTFTFVYVKNNCISN